jgi:glucoamylase
MWLTPLEVICAHAEWSKHPGGVFDHSALSGRRMQSFATRVRHILRIGLHGTGIHLRITRRKMLTGIGLGIAASGADAAARWPSSTRTALIPRPVPGSLLLDGVCEDPSSPGIVIPIPAGSGVRFVPGTSVAVGEGGPVCAGRSEGLLAYLSTRGPAVGVDALPSVLAARAWLASGLVPGTSTKYSDMATRALLDLRLALRANGALLAGPTSIWAYVWPRDASWAAVAFSATGHHAEARSILGFLARVQLRNGTWAARTVPDASGGVPDSRPQQLDAVGWVPWAVWNWYVSAPAGTARDSALRTLWPSVKAAADAACSALQPNGLPQAGFDYWEDERAVTIGNAAALRCGLQAAADLALRIGDGGSAARWSVDAAQLAMAVGIFFGSTGYRRRPTADAAADAAVAWLGPPFAAQNLLIHRAIGRAESNLVRSGGGVTPGVPRPVDTSESWTPETAFFALHNAAGRDPSVYRRLDWLTDHRTAVGSLPERVSPTGRPVSTAPLAWTNAVVLLALRALEQPLPIP